MNPIDDIAKLIGRKVDEAEARLILAIQTALITKVVKTGLGDLIALNPDRQAKYQAALDALA